MFPGVSFCPAGIAGVEFVETADELVVVGEEAEHPLRVLQGGFQGLVAVAQGRRDGE